MNQFICYDRCGTCKKAEKWMNEHNIPYEKRPIKEDHPSFEELKSWKETTGLPLKSLFNTSGQLYKSMELKNKLPSMDEEEQLQLLASDGMLVRRPIMVSEDKVLIGFKETQWAEHFRI